MNPTPEFPATSSPALTLTPSAPQRRAESAGSLADYFYERAQQSLNEVDPIPPAPIPSPCVSGEAQDINSESAGSPYLCDWSMDVRPSYRLSDAEMIDKGRWQLEALRKREVLRRALVVPTVYPKAK